LLIAATFLPWLLLSSLSINAWWIDDGHLLYSAVAAVLALIPALVTMAWCDLALGQSPEQQLAAVLGSTGIRMAFVVAIGLFLYFAIPAFTSTWFWLWIIGFYLWTLAVETVLLTRRQAELEKSASGNPPPP